MSKRSTQVFTMFLAVACSVFSQLCSGGSADAPRTMRVDYVHSGNALDEAYAISRVLIEPLAWAGNPARPIDDTNRGVNVFEVVDPKTNRVLYSRGFSTIFGEWKQTEEAHKLNRAFEESLRFPLPSQPVRIRVSKRDERSELSVQCASE